jgi:hypothetical protein
VCHNEIKTHNDQGVTRFSINTAVVQWRETCQLPGSSTYLQQCDGQQKGISSIGKKMEKKLVATGVAKKIM